MNPPPTFSKLLRNRTENLTAAAVGFAFSPLVLLLLTAASQSHTSRGQDYSLGGILFGVVLFALILLWIPISGLWLCIAALKQRSIRRRLDTPQPISLHSLDQHLKRCHLILFMARLNLLAGPVIWYFLAFRPIERQGDLVQQGNAPYLLVIATATWILAAVVWLASITTTWRGLHTQRDLLTAAPVSESV